MTAVHSRAWRERNPGADRAYYLANREQIIARVIANDDPERRRAYNASPAQKARVRAYRQTPAGREGHRQAEARRRATLAGALLIIEVPSADCGVCLQPLRPDATSRDPWSTTVGHEPPLAVVRREGWLVVVQRPEHWTCNNRKRARLDAEVAV